MDKERQYDMLKSGDRHNPEAIHTMLSESGRGGDVASALRTTQRQSDRSGEDAICPLHSENTAHMAIGFASGTGRNRAVSGASSPSKSTNLEETLQEVPSWASFRRERHRGIGRRGRSGCGAGRHSGS